MTQEYSPTQKIRTIVISPLGTFESDLKIMALSKTEIEELKKFFENINSLKYVSIERGSETLYFPSDIIRQSIIILDIRYD